MDFKLKLVPLDFVLTRGDEVCGIEFKAAKSVRGKDFSGLIHLQKETSAPSSLKIIVEDQR